MGLVNDSSLYFCPKSETMNSREKQLEALDRLLTIMDELRAQCPWDKKQTMETLRHLTIEETYELGDAILDNDLNEVKKELGDLLLHIFFYAKIGSETKDFDIADVAHDISEKLIQRHPHIYGDVSVKGEEEVKANWEKIKLQEGKKSVLEGVPNSLPALVKANRIQEKVAGVGFDWEAPEQVLEKVQEELGELQEAIARARERVYSSGASISFLKDQLTKTTSDIEEIVISDKNKHVIAPIDDITYLEAHGNYISFHMQGGNKYTVIKSLSHYEDILPVHQFFRIHKSYLINLNYVQSYGSGRGGHVLLQGNVRLAIAQRRKPMFVKIAKKKWGRKKMS